MRIGFLQFTPRFGEVAANLERVAAQLGETTADLLVLPELFATGYQFRDRAELATLAEPVDGPTAAALQSLAARTGGHLVAGFPERAGEDVFNAALLVNAQGVVGVFRKVHLFDQEKALFTPGDGGFPVFDLGIARVGIMICFDWYFPEAARSLALGGAEVIAHPANLVLPHCQGAMPTRCLENRVFAVTTNRCGTEDRRDPPLTFTGGSVIVTPLGETPARGPVEGDAVEVVEIDPAVARDKKPTPGNHLLEDRRPEMYRG